MPKTLGSQPIRRSRRIVVIPRPYCSPDPIGPNYEQYCYQSLMQHRCFCSMDNLLGSSESYINAYAAFLLSGVVPPCLVNDVYRLLQQPSEDTSADHLICLLQSWSTLTATPDLHFTTVLSLLPLSTAAGIHQESSAHDCNYLSN